MKNKMCSVHLSIFDSSSDLVFVADKKTKQLLYMNSPARKSCEIDPEASLDKYRLDEIFAKNEQTDTNFLIREKFTHWTFYDRIKHRHYGIMTTLMPIDGEDRIFQYAADISSSYMLATEERDFDDVSRILNQVVSFLGPNNDDFTEDLVTTLGVLGKLFNANKADAIICIKPYFNTPTKFEWVNENFKETPLSEFVTDSFIKQFAGFVSTLENPYIKVDELTILWPKVREYYANQGTRAVYMIPMQIRDQVFGFLTIHNPDKDKIHKLRQVVTDICSFISGALWNVKHFEMLKKQSMLDLQTNLYNKQTFKDDLAKIDGCSLGVVLVDINGLNTINQSLGQAHGDKVISQTTQILQNTEEDELNFCKAYRLGSDKFALVITEKSEISFNQIVKRLENTFSGEIGFSATIGNAYVPSCSHLLSSMTAEDAEKDLFEKKREFYRTQKNAAVVTKYIAEDDSFLAAISNLNNIQSLVSNNNFFVVVQPIYDAKTKKVAYGEALIRLQYDGKFISPGQFIPLIENLHLSYVVDYFVFREMCKTIAERIAQGFQPVPIATNFSRFTVEREDFIRTIVETVDSYEIPHNMVYLEVTESASGTNYDTLVETTSKLTEMGFKISLDDFGVAHANLTTLAEFTIGTLKLDKKLIDRIIANERMRQIIQNLISMFTLQGISTVAEGVETHDQLDVLTEMGCTMIQGFLLSKPLPLNDFLDISDQSEENA